jgi:hypothetical protein
MQAGLTGRVWEIADVIGLLDAADTKSGMSGGYTSRVLLILVAPLAPRIGARSSLDR